MVANRCGTFTSSKPLPHRIHATNFSSPWDGAPKALRPSCFSCSSATTVMRRRRKDRSGHFSDHHCGHYSTNRCTAGNQDSDSRSSINADLPAVRSDNIGKDAHRLLPSLPYVRSLPHVDAAQGRRLLCVLLLRLGEMSASTDAERLLRSLN
jgi:hypothetical protein